MIRHISKSLTEVLVRYNYADSDKQDWYTYGFELLFSQIINYAIMLLIGLLCGKLLLTAVYMGVVFLLRGSTGGYHAKSSTVCMLSSFVLLFFVLHLTTQVPDTIIPILLLSLIPVGIVIFLYAPINHPDLNMDKNEIANNKRQSRIIFFIIAIIAVSLGILNLAAPMVKTICFGLITVSALILLAKVSKQEVKIGKKDTP